MTDPGPTKETIRKIQEIAVKRVEAMPWATIAREYGYKDANTCQATIQGGWPALWRKEYEKARELHLDGCESEAIFTQRELMRQFQVYTDKKGRTVTILRDEKIRQAAAHSMLNHASRQRSMKIDITTKTDQEQMQGYMEALQSMIRTMPGNQNARPVEAGDPGAEPGNGKGKSPGGNGG